MAGDNVVITINDDGELIEEEGDQATILDYPVDVADATAFGSTINLPEIGWKTSLTNISTKNEETASVICSESLAIANEDEWCDTSRENKHKNVVFPCAAAKGKKKGKKKQMSSKSSFKNVGISPRAKANARKFGITKEPVSKGGHFSVEENKKENTVVDNSQNNCKQESSPTKGNNENNSPNKNGKFGNVTKSNFGTPLFNGFNNKANGLSNNLSGIKNGAQINKGNESKGGVGSVNNLKALFYGDHIVCRSFFDASRQADDVYKNICLSYPFVDGIGEEKRFVAYYRWIIWSFLIFCLLNLLPRLWLKWFNDVRFTAFLDHISSFKSKFDIESENKMYTCALKYMQSHVNMHKKFILCYIFGHIIAFIVDLFTVYFYNFMLQDQFIGLMSSANIFDRNYENYKDYLSVVFPPFVNCTLSIRQGIVGKRSEEFGCHLTYMEVYEKFFVFLWFWFMLMFLWGAVHHVYLFGVFIYTKCDFFFMTSCKSFRDLRRCKQIILTRIDLGDLYVLYLLKGILGECLFRRLVIELAEYFQLKAVDTKFCELDISRSKNARSSLATSIKPTAPEGDAFDNLQYVRYRKTKS